MTSVVASNPQSAVDENDVISRRSVLELTAAEARSFFLKSSSYCDLDLPPYISFDQLLDGVSRVLLDIDLKGVSSSVREYDDVNYTILNNKDGKYAWRPYQLIHPAIYASLVHRITEEATWQFLRDRFNEWSNDKIKCVSIPQKSLSKKKDKAEQIIEWWSEAEQQSLELALEFQHSIVTDVTDCYGSIYTHSIVWALHTKEVAKGRKQDYSLIGNEIDRHLQDMRQGQTNGIPQGSVLMDFIAEMVLGHADEQLSSKLSTANVSDYRIVRYRDDYRIFVNSSKDGETIIKTLTEVLVSLGLKLNPSKTKKSDNVVRSSIKDDKLAWITKKNIAVSLQKHLLVIHDHATAFPNSGSLLIALDDFNKRLTAEFGKLRRAREIKPLVSIVVDIAFKSPRTYSVAASILSRLVSLLEDDQKKALLEKMLRKFSLIPNTGHMDIWLQRITLTFDKRISYQERICELVAGEDTALWNNEWISSRDLKASLDSRRIIDQGKLANISPVIPLEEYELFPQAQFYA